jgi:3-methyladenine DNA glycosylase AlkD
MTVSFDVTVEADGLSTALRAFAAAPVDPSPIIRTSLPFYGVSIPNMERLARAWHRAHPEAEPAEVFVLAEALWQRAIREEMVLAAMLVGLRAPVREGFDLPRLERWGELLGNWETTDNLGGRVLGPWVAAAPQDRLGTLETLTGQSNPWLRRLALVGCVYLGRRSDAAAWWPRVAGIVLTLAADKEAAIPKAISWVLRVFTAKCPEEVSAFLEEQGRALPAIAVREARNKLATGYKAGKPRPPAGTSLAAR